MTFFQSEGTAARRRAWVYLVDATDGITPETGEAAGQPQVSKNGAAFANTTATLTAVGNGTYYVELTAAELSDLGRIFLRYKSANTVEYSMVADVVAMNVFTAAPDVNVLTITASAITAASIATDAITNAKIAADAIGASEIANGAIDAATFAAGAIDAAAIANGAIDAATFAAGAIDAAAIADGAIDAATFAAGAITATVIATDAIDADAIAANAVTEIQSGLATQTSVDDLPTNAELATALAAADDAVLAAVAGVQADTDNIQTRLPAALVGGKMDSDATSISGDSVAADNAEAFFDGTGYAGTNNVIPSVTTVTGNVNGTIGGTTAGAITATSIATGAIDADALAADAATEIATAVLAGTIAELGVAAPAATPTLAQAVMLPYMALRDKRTVTSTKDTIFNDAGVAIAHADLQDDGTTFTASELASGA